MENRLSGPAAHTVLRGRAGECAVLDALVGAVRGGESRSLVLRGEAGIGKTALLEHLVGSAGGVTVVRSVGVESEMELAFASLHQLCGPMLHRLGRLPAPQRHALEIVFGLTAGAPPDRFLVGLAVLSLLSEVAEEHPLLCGVDDAQWLDQASALTLAFVARRLQAEPVGMVFAAREPGEELRHLAVLEVPGLVEGDARAHLRAAHDQLTAIGMEGFAERARHELLATGEKVRRRTVETRDELTAQERQIARDGLSNPEIGARLFLSPRTVEWHLGKVFGKLGIRSRRELATALSESELVAA